MQRIEPFVVRHDEVGVMADEQPPLYVVAKLLYLLDLFEQGDGVDDDTIADNADATLVKNTGRNEMEHDRFVVETDGMAGIGATLIPDNNVIFFGKVVNKLSLSFIAELCSDNDGSITSRLSECF